MYHQRNERTSKTQDKTEYCGYICEERICDIVYTFDSATSGRFCSNTFTLANHMHGDLNFQISVHVIQL